MKNRLIILLIFTLPNFCFKAEAQTNFNNRYIFNKPAVIFGGIEKSNSKLIVAGLLAYNLPPRFPCKNIITTFDEAGNSLDTLHYSLGIPDKEYCTFFNLLIPTNDKGWLVGGYTLDTVIQNVFITKYDSLFDVQFYKEFEDTSFNFSDIKSIYQSSSGDFYLLGRSSRSLTPSTNLIHFQILKTDSLGNLIWWKHYEPTPESDAGSIVTLTDSTLLIGWCYTNSYSSNTVPGKGNTKLSIIDTAGNLISTWTDPVDSTFVPNQIIKTKDNGFAYASTYKKDQQYNGVYYADMLLQGRVVKLDSAFNKIWVRNMGVPAATNSLNFIRELSNGSLIAGGQYYDRVLNFYASSSSGWLCKLNANGDSVWNRIYRGVNTSDNWNYFQDIVILNDGSIVACGQSKDNTATTQSQRGWLIRVDSMGCLIPGCDTLTATSIKEASEEVIGVTVYPNPCKEMVYILMKSDNDIDDISFEVFNIKGAKMAEEKKADMNITYLLNTQNYLSGLYFIKVKQKQKVIAVRKFLKQE